MRILVDDSVVDSDRCIGIVESRSGRLLTVRYPDRGNVRIKRDREELRPLAELIHQARYAGRPLQLGPAISLTGDSILAELVSLFGYSTGRLNSASLDRVLRQLERAGLEIETLSNVWGRDEKFRLTVSPGRNGSRDLEIERNGEEAPGNNGGPDLVISQVEIPDPFWPTALGLPQIRALEFLRALTLNAPIVCVLYLPEEAPGQTWLQGTWEGLTSWSYHTAQRFHFRHELSSGQCGVRIGSVELIHSYLRPTVLDQDAPRLLDSQRSLNLVTIKRDAEQPNDFDRFNAIWPGSVFEFRPEGMRSEDLKTVNNCLRIVGGSPLAADWDDSPLKVLVWAKRAYAQLMSSPVASWGSNFASSELKRFKGSNEGSTTLALKAHVANWVRLFDESVKLEFEFEEAEFDPQLEEFIIHQRVDLLVRGYGHFEIESMNGSGPMESFYQNKIFSRIDKKSDKPFWLCVPNETVLWAGPYLADLAFHLGERGRVVVPSADGKVLQIVGRQLTSSEPEEFAGESLQENQGTDAIIADAAITMKDVAGYEEVRSQIDEQVIWSERHRFLLEGTSKSSGILFFGPPGCGKSRWARAIAGELEQEVRLLAPSDLRGPYLGWGQLMIREQFNWLADKASRMLIIDELDAVARSRRERQMHTDDMASVNELLVQLDKALRLGRLVVGTTNFIGSMDDALTRSGRFGRYIPIGPPDAEESAGIVVYYLNRLVSQSNTGSRLKVATPSEQAVREMVFPMFEESRQRQQFLCGADLEEAVNRAYLRCAKDAASDRGWAGASDPLNVSVSPEELRRSLLEVPRSVTSDSLEQFFEDVQRFCGQQAVDLLSRRLGR